MTPLVFPLLTLIVAVQSTPTPPAETSVARVNGEELPFAEFEQWMVRAHGWRFLDDFIDLALLRQEARRIALPLPGAAEVEAAFERDWADRVELRGDETALLAELARAGMDKASYRDRQLGTIEQETIARAILKTRPPTDEMLKELFTKEFGKAGLRTHVRVAFFDRLKALKPGTTASKDDVAKMAGSAKERAYAFHEKVKADRSQFAALVADSDRCLVERLDATPLDTRKNAGDVPRLHPEWFGGLVSKAIEEARAGDLVGPIEAPSGCYVVDVVARATVTFADVEPELRELWSSRIPAAGEVFWLKDELRKKAKIEKSALNPPAH